MRDRAFKKSNKIKVSFKILLRALLVGLQIGDTLEVLSLFAQRWGAILVSCALQPKRSVVRRGFRESRPGNGLWCATNPQPQSYNEHVSVS